MVFSAKSSSNSNNNTKNNNNEGNWGMGFLLILFHHHPDDNHNNNHTNHNHNHNQFTKKKTSFSLSSSSFATKSTNLLLSKTQSTLSICGLLVFTTLLLFTLSTFEPTSVLHHHHHHTSLHATSSRRFLQQGNKKSSGNAHKRFSVKGLFSPVSKGSESNFTHIASSPASALQGMGALYLRGTKAMTDLVVGHVPEDTSEKEIVSFFRVLQHSGVLSRVDFVFVFSSPLSAMRFGPIVESECRAFLRLVQLAGELDRFAESGRLSYGLTRYLKGTGEGEKVPMWGKRRGNLTESARASYGSVVGFEVGELDPEASLSGFLDHVTMSSRRWAGYPMLLGRVRRQFKHMMLVNVKSTLILSDPFIRVKNRTSESLFLWSNSEAELGLPTRHHGKRNLGKSLKSQLNLDHTASVISPGVPKTRSLYNADVLVGGSRGVRRFATAALTEIVRGVVERKGKGRNSLTEAGLVNQVVRSGHLLKNINLIAPTESIPELSSLAGFNSDDSDSGSSFLKLSDYFSVVQRGRSSGGSGGSLDIDNVVMREICASHKIYSSVYSDCLATSQ